MTRGRGRCHTEDMQFKNPLKLPLKRKTFSNKLLLEVIMENEKKKRIMLQKL